MLAKKYPNIFINSVCPDFVQTDITCNIGYLTAEEGAEIPVSLALPPDGGPSVSLLAVELLNSAIVYF